MRGKLFQTFATLAAAFLGATSAHAALTSIGKTPANEPSHEQILEHQYGGDWHKVGDDYYNGSMSAKRMDDWLSDPSVLNIKTGQCGYSTDETWCGDSFKISSVAKFSDYTQHIAALDAHGHTHDLFSTNGYGYAIDPASQVLDLHGQQFKWIRSGESGTETSMVSDNNDQRDHLITYVIDGVPGVSGPVWMLFWEDIDRTLIPSSTRTFADFNDLVLEVRSVVTPIPLPPAGWAGLVTLACGALVRGRKLISKAMTA
jgi:hypothetical protein